MAGGGGSGKSRVAVSAPAEEPKRGPYCAMCRGFVPEDRLVPLKGKRRIAPKPWTLGQEIGRCRWHRNAPANAGVVAYVAEAAS